MKKLEEGQLIYCSTPEIMSKIMVLMPDHSSWSDVDKVRDWAGGKHYLRVENENFGVQDRQGEKWMYAEGFLEKRLPLTIKQWKALPDGTRVDLEHNGKK